MMNNGIKMYTSFHAEKNVTEIVLDKDINIMKGSIPDHITRLVIKNKFGQVLERDLFPSGLTHLQILGYKHQPKFIDIPPSVTHLKINFRGLIYDKYVIPHGITHLDLEWFNSDRVIIPNTVTHLKIKSPLNLKCSNPNQVIIPNSVTHLEINSYNRIPEKLIPNSVIYLSLSTQKSLVPGIVPNSVKYLSLSMDKSLVPGIVPNSVTHLKWIPNHSSYSFLPGAIPDSVTHLMIGHCSSIGPCSPVLNIKGIIPDSVTHLCVASGINVESSIPDSVRYLELTNLNQELNKENTPKNLETLVLDSNCKQKIDLDCQIIVKEYNYDYGVKIMNQDDYHIRLLGYDMTLLEDVEHQKFHKKFHKIFDEKFNYFIFRRYYSSRRYLLTPKKAALDKMVNTVVEALQQQLLAANTNVIQLTFDKSYQDVKDRVCQRVNQEIGKEAFSATIVGDQVVFNLSV